MNFQKESSINDLPNELLTKIFLCASAKHLVSSVMLVCKKWFSVIDTQAFWIAKCCLDSKLTDKLAKYLNGHRALFNAKQIYFENTFMKNLIKNPRLEQMFYSWGFKDCGFSISNDCTPTQMKLFIQNFSSQVAAYDGHFDLPSASSDSEAEDYDDDAYEERECDTYAGKYSGWTIKRETEWKNQKPFNYFINSSYDSCKYQVVDLLEQENKLLNTEVLNTLRPDIEVAEEFAFGNTYCTGVFKVFLVNNAFEIVDTDEEELCLDDSRYYYFESSVGEYGFAQAKYTFKYKEPVRYVIHVLQAIVTSIRNYSIKVKFTVKLVDYDFSGVFK